MEAGAKASGSVPSERGYRGPQVCSIVGITYRQLDYWARTDLLQPSISEARGSGSQRLYSYTDLVQLKVIKRLLDAGVSLHAARKAIDCLRSSGDDLTSANLVIDDRRSVLAHSGEEITDLGLEPPAAAQRRTAPPTGVAGAATPAGTAMGRAGASGGRGRAADGAD